MSEKKLSVMVFALAAFAGAAAAAQALPDDRVVAFNLREDPQDPESDVVFRIELVLHAMSEAGSTIGWRIDEAVFTQLDGESVVAAWSKTLPTVPGSGGLWWVTHADTGAPTLGEFVMPPHLTGTAELKQGSGADLDYDFEGVAYSPPPGGAPFEPTAAMSYDLRNNSTEEPIENEEEAPTELEDH